MLFVGVLAALVVAYVLFSAWKTSSYYRKILRKQHYAEVVDWLRDVLQRGDVADPRFEDHTATQTSGKCTLTFTRDITDQDLIHIAMSQSTRPTDHAVCSRLAFLIVEALEVNQFTSDFYYTESRIHHLLLSRAAGGDWLINDTDTVVAQMKSYEPIQFRFQPLESAP